MSLTLNAKIGEVGKWLGPGSLNFFGLPFAGKSTQVERLATNLGATIIDGGDILRETPLPPEVSQNMNNGALISSEHFKNTILPFLSRAVLGRPIILGSVGRVHGEEEDVLQAAEGAKHPIMAAIHLDISEEVARVRWRAHPRERLDDNESAFTRRLMEFEAKTIPVLETYKSMGLLVTVDAMRPEPVVFERIVEQLHAYAMTGSPLSLAER